MSTCQCSWLQVGDSYIAMCTYVYVVNHSMYMYRISLNRHLPRIVAAQLEALSEINAALNSSRG